MTTQVLKFSRSAPNEAQFRAIAQTGAPPTAELATAAMELLRAEERKIRFSEPRLDFVAKFERLATMFPSAMQLVLQASNLGPQGVGTIDPSEVADVYMEAE